MLNEDFTKNLKSWCSEHKVLDKCRRNFWKCFENYKREEPREFSEVFRNENRKFIRIDLDKIKLCQNYKIDYGKPTVEIDFEITLKEKYIGWYREVYFFNGELVDDFFVIESPHLIRSAEILERGGMI